MDIDLANFREIPYENGKIFFDKRYVFHEHFQHKRKTLRFPYYKNVLVFLAENSEVQIYFTLDDRVKPFRKIELGYILHMDSYIEFCRAISSSTKGRIKAFLSQHINLKDIAATEADKDEFVKANANEKNMLEAIASLPSETQKSISDSLLHLQTLPVKSVEPEHKVTSSEFLNAFKEFLTNKEVQSAFIQNIPQIQIQILTSHIEFLKSNLDKNETFIQNWIDEEDGKYRKQRCLVFGVEYIDPKREGRLSAKRFDILAEQNRGCHVIIELKSPNANIFDIETSENQNGGMSEEYHLSKEISRAIPQVLGYKKWYERATAEEIKALGIMSKKEVSRCIIVIGQDVDDVVWKENFKGLRASFTGVEICTYTELINKLENTVHNLQETLG